jgi:hypothetical protein
MIEQELEHMLAIAAAREAESRATDEQVQAIGARGCAPGVSFEANIYAIHAEDIRTDNSDLSAIQDCIAQHPELRQWQAHQPPTNA